MKKIIIVLIRCFCVCILLGQYPGRAAQNGISVPWNQIGSVAADADGLRLHCLFQRLDARATAQGLELVSTAGSQPSAPFSVRAVAVGRDLPGSALPPDGVISVQDSLAVWSRPGLTEEYSVSMDGIRQDFLVTTHPAGNGELRVELAVADAMARSSGDGVELILSDSHRKLTYSRFKIMDAREREIPARVEVVSNSRIQVVVADMDAVYPIRIDPTFADANWVGLSGYIGLSGAALCAVVDTNAGIVYVGGGFGTAGTIPANNVAGWNGSNWFTLGRGVSGRVYALALDGAGNLYAGGSFFSAGNVAATNIAKWDGASWSSMGGGLVQGGVSIGTPVTALAVDAAGHVFAGGQFYQAGSSSVGNIAEWDGTNWLTLNGGIGSLNSLIPGVTALAFDSSGNLFVGGTFTSAGGFAATNIAVWNGSVWSNVGGGFAGSAQVLAMAASGSNVYVGGYFSKAGTVAATNIACWNGVAWTNLSLGLNSGVEALAADKAGHVYAGGNFSSTGGIAISQPAVWDGNTWSSLRSGNSRRGASAVTGFALDASGNLYVLGGFTNLLGVALTNSIAQWNGTNWLPMGSGIQGSVNALASDNSGNLYVGGSFIAVQSGMPTIACSNLAVWNGSNWSGLGSGISGNINSLLISGTNLYAGGQFTNIGNMTVGNIATWNGNAWLDLAGGMNGPVYALSVDVGSNIYAGGAFSTAGGVFATNIAIWNGTAWSAMGTGLGGTSNSVHSLNNRGTNMIAAGAFYKAGSVSVTNIAQWDGVVWSAVGAGLDASNHIPVVNALATDRYGILYAGGSFDHAGSVPTACIAAWNGSAWSALGGGISGAGSNILSLVVDPGNNLYAGGNFSTASNSVSVSHVAVWNGSAWLPLGSGISGSGNYSVNALALDDSGNLIVGGIFSNAGTNSALSLAMLRNPGAHIGVRVAVVSNLLATATNLVSGATVQYGISQVISVRTNYFSITNDGSVNLLLPSLQFYNSRPDSNGVFYLANSFRLPATIPPGGSTNFMVFLETVSNGVTAETMQIQNNTPGNNPFVVNLTGTGDSPPQITFPGNITTNALTHGGTIVNFTVSATDFLDGSLPAYASRLSGSLFPMGNNLVTVRATNNAGMVSQQIFFVDVLNSPPVLGALSNYVVNPGQSVSFTATAFDTNGDALTFRFLNPPVYANIDTNGVFSWRPHVSQAGTTNNIGVVVTDNGTPNLSTTNFFTVQVNPLSSTPLLSSASYTSGVFGFTVDGPSGPDYVVLFTSDLTNWIDLTTNFAPVPPFYFTDPNSTNGAGYFRIRLEP